MVGQSNALDAGFERALEGRLEDRVDRIDSDQVTAPTIDLNGVAAVAEILYNCLFGIKLVTLTLTLGQTSAALHVPLGYVYLVLPLSGLLTMFFSVSAVARHHAELHGPDAAAGQSAESR